jgi:hypothetical protein
MVIDNMLVSLGNGVRSGHGGGDPFETTAAWGSSGVGVWHEWHCGDAIEMSGIVQHIPDSGGRLTSGAGQNFEFRKISNPNRTELILFKRCPSVAIFFK